MYLQAVVVAQAVSLTACTVVAHALGEGAGYRRTARAIVAVSFAGPALLYVDALVRAHTGVHLAELVPVLLDAHAEENRRILEATGIDAPRAVGVIVALVPALLAAAWLDAKAEPPACASPAGSEGSLEDASPSSGWRRSPCSRASSWERHAPCAPHRGSRFNAPYLRCWVLSGPFRVCRRRWGSVALRLARSEASVARAVAQLEIPQAPPGDVLLSSSSTASAATQ